MAQSDLIIRPPASQAAAVTYPADTGGGGGSGGAADSVAMTEITNWVVTADPDSRLSATSHTAGLIDMTRAGDTTVYDGYRENGPGYEVLITDIPGWEDFDPALDTMFIEVEFVLLESQGNDTMGVWVGVVDEDFDNRASADGYGLVIEGRGVQLFRALSITDGNLGAGGTISLTGDKDAARMKFCWNEGASNYDIAGMSQYRTASGNYELGIVADGGTMTGDGSGWYLQCRCCHRSTTSGTPQYQLRVYAGRYRAPTQS